MGAQYLVFGSGQRAPDGNIKINFGLSDVNGEKIGRLYGRWMHIGALPEGEVEVKVSLNSNSHGVIAVDGNPVEAAVTVDTR